MKKRILSVLLCLCLGLTSFLTTAFTAFAADGANWSDEANRDTIWTDGAISTPEQLAQFAYLVNTGAYTGKNDVWLTQDVDLAGHEWTAIGEYKGSLQDYTGDTSKFFRGVFDGNGYTVKNMQLTKFPGGTLDLCIVGLFGGTNATIRNLTVTGTAATQDSSARIYMGAIAGMYPEGTISNCTSRLSMDITTTGVSYIGGVVGSSSGAITRCTNDANITIHSKNTNVGGIVAGSQHGEIDRCVNKGKLAGEAAFTGGISAYVFGAPSTVTNCANYGEITSTAAVPSSIGGIIGLYNGTGMSNCYNTGLIQPQRSGGLIGQVDETALNTLGNLYYSAEGSALGVYKRGNTVVTEEKNDVGVKKTEADMKQENFVADLNGNGDAFVSQKDGFPTIAPLAVNVVIDATPKDAVVSLSQSEGGAAIDPQPDGSYILLPGDYFIQASAADHYPVSFAHTVSYDRSTLLVTITLEPLPADYSKVDEAIEKANALNKDEYKDFTAVEAAVEEVERGKNITEQSEVDAMAKAIEDAIGALQYKDADYTKVDEAIARANALNKDEYKDFTAVEAAVEEVERGKNITGQSEVDAMAKAIEDAIGALQYKDADYTKVDEAIERAEALNKDEYKDFTAVEAAVEAVERGKNITEQAAVDAMAKAIEDAIGALQYKDADYTKVDEAIERAEALNKDEYKDFTAVEAAVEAVERGKNITEQAAVDAMAKAIEDAIGALQYKDADYTKVDEAIERAEALNKDEYKDFTAVEAAVEAVERGKNITGQSEVDAMAKAIEDAIGALQYKDADYTKVDEAIARAEALNKDEYKDFTAVEAAVEAVERGKNITGQAAVDAMAKAIEDAIGALQYKDADYTKVDEAIERAEALNKDEYKDFTAVEAAVEAVERGKNITGQSEVDAMAKAIEDAIGALQYKDADYTKVDEAIARANALNKDEYKDFTAVEAAVEAVERGKNITGQSEVDAMAKAIEDAINSLQRKTAEPPKEKPTENPTDKPTEKPSDFTQTGDSANLSAWIFLLLISGIGILGAAFYPRKRKTQ